MATVENTYEPASPKLALAAVTTTAMKPPRTVFSVTWPHDGARQLEVVVDTDLPPFGPMEQRIRGITAIASSHGGLRMQLESAFADRWSIGVFETVSSVTGVHLAPLPDTRAKWTTQPIRNHPRHKP